MNVKLNTTASAESLRSFDSVVLATGVLPRDVKIPNKSTGGKVSCVSYVDVLRHQAPVGKSVAVIGAGGIGFDVSDFLTHIHNPREHGETDTAADEEVPLQGKVDHVAVSQFLRDWGVGDPGEHTGGLIRAEPTGSKASTSSSPSSPPAGGAVPRKIFLLQRKEGKLGLGLGKTTGWIHRSTMKMRGVEELSGCKYVEINDDGLVIERKGKKTTLPVDTVVICAGQEPLRELLEPLTKPVGSGAAKGPSVFMIGGAQEAGELDAKRAIDQGTRLAAVIETATTGQVFEAPVGFMPTLIRTAEKYLKKK